MRRKKKHRVNYNKIIDRHDVWSNFILIWEIYQNISSFPLSNPLFTFPGASGGIGSATAEQFAKLGAKLALTGRDESKLQATAAACKAAGTQDVSRQTN